MSSLVLFRVCSASKVVTPSTGVHPPASPCFPTNRPQPFAPDMLCCPFSPEVILVFNQICFAPSQQAQGENETAQVKSVAWVTAQSPTNSGNWRYSGPVHTSGHPAQGPHLLPPCPWRHKCTANREYATQLALSILNSAPGSWLGLPGSLDSHSALGIRSLQPQGSKFRKMYYGRASRGRLRRLGLWKNT